jgi:hypothetical protein
MPICEADPWRLQYFAQAACPADVNIPTEDADAWTWHPRHRWVYDKLAIALSQGLAAGPHGTTPPRFPAFSKPIYNLKGMGADSRVIASPEDYAQHETPGHFWMTLLEGEHVSSDVAVVDGEPRWWRHVTGKPAGEGTFDFWTVHAASDPDLEEGCGAWLRRHLAGYTGMLNLETIGGAIIEAHLRFSDQWPDLYGAGWVEALIQLYQTGVWSCGASPTATDAMATASCCSGRTGGATVIRRVRSSTRFYGCRTYRACKSPSTRIAILDTIRCRRAAFAWRSSMLSISTWGSRRANA